jgi:hypothetical protein
MIATNAVAADTHRLSFDHFELNESLAYAVDAADGDTIAVDVLNTCPSQFAFEVEGIERAPEEARTRDLQCTAANKEVRWTHRGEYGGYLLMITAPGPVPVTRGGETRALQSVVLVIHVRATGWALEVGGGFTVDGLVSPRFALQTRAADGGDATFVVRDADSDDAANLGLATFIHAYHHKAPAVALSFGLGLGEASRTTYFTGLSIRLSSKAALTGGVAWGNVDRLPAGVTLATPVTDQNILGDLPTRVGAKPFVALSYGFLGSRDRLGKPFAGTTPAE